MRIILATYGPAHADSEDYGSQHRVRYVTSELQDRVVGSRLKLGTFNAIFGDPAEDVSKLLRVRYLLSNGAVRNRVFAEGESVLLDADSHQARSVSASLSRARSGSYSESLCCGTRVHSPAHRGGIERHRAA